MCDEWQRAKWIFASINHTCKKNRRFNKTIDMSRRESGVYISNPIADLLKQADKDDRRIAVLYICNYWLSGVLPPSDGPEGAKALFEAWLKRDTKINHFKWKEGAHGK